MIYLFQDASPLVLRGALAAFFVCSGFHKLFNPIRRATLRATFVADKAPLPVPFLMLAIPLGELFGGLAIGAGFLTSLASLGLIAICVGACVLDGSKRIASWRPLDRADYLGDVLYLPETLYVVMLLSLLLSGPGMLAVDSLVHL